LEGRFVDLAHLVHSSSAANKPLRTKLRHPSAGMNG